MLPKTAPEGLCTSSTATLCFHWTSSPALVHSRALHSKLDCWINKRGLTHIGVECLHLHKVPVRCGDPPVRLSTERMKNRTLDRKQKLNFSKLFFPKKKFHVCSNLLPPSLLGCVLPRTWQFTQAGEGQVYGLKNFTGTVAFRSICATAASTSVAAMPMLVTLGSLMAGN